VDGIDPALFEEFIIEARETLDQAEADFLLLESEGDSGDPEIVNRLFRALHSIKGGSGFFDLERIGSLSHSMENVLSGIRNGKISLNSELTSYLFFSLDLLKRMVGDPGSSNAVDIDKPLQVLKSFAEHEEKLSTGIEQEATSSPEENTEAGDAGNSNENPEESNRRDAFEETAGASVLESVDLAKRKELARFGMNLYRLEIPLADSIEQREMSLAGFIDGISELGEVLAVEPDVDQSGGLETCADDDYRITLAVATVLDPDLAPAGFDIHPDYIEKIPLNNPKSPASIKQASTQPGDGKPDASREENSVRPAEPVEKIKTPAEEKKKSGDVQSWEPPAAPSGSIKKPFNPSLQRPEDTVRVKTSILNSLMEMAGELVLGRNRLFHIIGKTGNDTDGLASAKTSLSAITTGLQQEIIKTRLQPISSLFGRYTRMVRDLSRKLGKEVALVTEGMNVELDRAILESLSDPLTHLVRNAMDHGIEPPDIREKAAKPRSGTVSLTAYNESGVVVIEIRDDGRGIEPEWIVSRALSKRIVTEDLIDRMSDEQILDLVLLPGFSTVEEVTSVSGRGVGLDVVKTNIERLGGDVELDSTPGRGTVVSLKLPLTLAILPALLISSAGKRFAVPQGSVEEVIRLDPAEAAEKVEQVGQMQALRHRNNLLPLLDLADILGVDRSFGGGANSDAEIRRLLVLKSGRHRYGLFVDRILDNEEIVVKPLSRYLRSLPYYSGGSILGDGDIVLILDSVGIAHATGIDKNDLAQSREKSNKKAVTNDISKELFLFDPGGGEILALPFFQVSRIERLADDGIERIGDVDCFNRNGDSMPLLDIRNLLDLASGEGKGAAPTHILLPRGLRRAAAFPVSRIIDPGGIISGFNTDSFKHDGVFGTCSFGKRVVLLLDLDGISRLAGFSSGLTCSESLRGLSVLLVDKPGFLSTLQRIQLERAGIAVTAVADIEKAWRKLQDADIDTILLDSSMIGEHDSMFLHRIGNDDSLSDIPPIALLPDAGRDRDSICRNSEIDSAVIKLDGTGILSALEALSEVRSGRAV